jgi:ABC-type uncharacterized transport system permease subunit
MDQLDSIEWQMTPTWSIGLKVMDKMEISFLSNQEILASLFGACMRYQSCLLDHLYISMVRALNNPFQLVL